MNDPEMEARMRADLATIRETLGEGATDNDAAVWAVASHAHCLKNGAVVLTPQALGDRMGAYAAYCLSHYVGEHIRAVDAGNGLLAFEKVDGPLPEMPAVH